MRVIRLINESSIAIDFTFDPSDDWVTRNSAQNIGLRKGDYVQLARVGNRHARTPDDDWFQAEYFVLPSLDDLPRDTILHMEGVVYEATAHYVPRKPKI